MMNHAICHCIFLWITIHQVVGVARVPSDEENLLQLLFNTYNPAARPVINSSHTVNVNVHFSLLQIQDLILRKQEFHTAGLLILEWKDERLKWDERRIQMEDISVSAKKIWLPEFASINGVNGIYDDYSGFNAIIHSDGTINWEPGGVFKTTCEIDITYYPFDEQVCELAFGAWSYHTTKMNLSTMDQRVNMDSYKENGEWEVIKTEVTRHEFFFECCPNERFANVVFKVHMRRKYAYYIMNMVLPSVMTSILLLSVFFCTPAQKVHICIAVLLSFRFFLMSITSSIPKTDTIPLIGIYLSCTMAYTTLSMILTVFVLNLHHMNDRPVPDWVNSVVRGHFARCLCMCEHQMPTSPRDVTDIDEKDKEKTYAHDWKLIAEVMDRLFFWVFVSVVIFTTVPLFYPIVSRELLRTSSSVNETAL